MKTYKSIMAIVVACAMAFSMPADARDSRGGHRGGHMKMGKMCMEKLPLDKQKVVQDVMRQSKEKNRSLFERMRKAHDRMREISTAEKFNKQAFIAAGDEMAAIHMKMARNRTEMMAKVAEKLTVQERRGMVECMHSKFRKMKDKHNDGDSFNE